MLNAKHGLIAVGDWDMDHISFGQGGKPLVMLPGLGEALRSVKGTALSFALMYRAFAREHTVYVFGRKNQLPPGYSIREMAEDQAQALHSLGLAGACVMGVSQGGMIAMHLAAAYPQLVARLVLANTAARCTATLERVVGNWLQLAETDDYKSLFIDTAEKSYTEEKLKKYRHLYPILTAMNRPKSWERFNLQARACLGHDADKELAKIHCPTLVIGGDRDLIVGSEAAPELAKQIANCRLTICEGYGHGAYEECPDFNARVLDFFDRDE